MRVVRRIISILVVAFGAGTATGALALEDVKTAAAAKAPLEMFKNPQQALNKYLEGYRAGDSHASIDALRYAAEGGEALARWKLASMYAVGDGVPHDDVKAFEYFESIVDAYDESNLNPRERGIVASAFVAVGTYSLNGIANSSVSRDTGRAYEMFSYSATEFGDPHAQYNLGMMYLDGAGVTKDVRRGARWLRLAADKQHMESQAVLGRIYFNGIDGVQRQRALGLMYLTMAREAAGDRKNEKWIVDLYDSAMASASDVDRQAALVYLEGYVNGHH
jgi:TPR repeat protein